MMKSLAFLLSFVTGFAGVCLSAGADELPLPSMRAALNHLQLRETDLADEEAGNWCMDVSGAVSAIPGWEVDWCEEGSSTVVMEDSTGRKAPEVKCSSWFADRKNGNVYFSPRNWLPAAGAQWVRVKGEIPVVLSRREAVTAPVTLKLVKGASVPVVLKGAGMGKDGGEVDVAAQLVVTEYRDVRYTEDSEGAHKKVLGLDVKAEAPLGLRDMELKTVDGSPIEGRNWGWGEMSRLWEIDRMEEGEIQVSVRYSRGLRPCRVVVDGMASVSGFFSCNGNGGRKDSSKGSDGVLPSSFMTPRKKAGQAGNPVMAELACLSMYTERGEDGGDEAQVGFCVELSVKKPAVFGWRADATEQSLEVTDSAGRVLSPAVFDLTWLSNLSCQQEGMTVLELCGKGKEFASPGAEWMRLRGTLRVPVAVMQESPVYELPLVKGAELQIPVPGAAPAGVDGIDVLEVRDVPTCQLKMKDLRDGKDKDMEISLKVVGVPFDLDCFELVDERGNPLKTTGSSCPGGSLDPEMQEWFWYSRFSIKNAADMKLVRVRLKYKINQETVNVPVDCRIGLQGPLSPKADARQP